MKQELPAVPREFICPITQEVIVDSVQDKRFPTHFYERTAIIEALKYRAESPINREPMTLDDLQDAPILKEQILDWLKKGLKFCNDKQEVSKQKMRQLLKEIESTKNEQTKAPLKERQQDIVAEYAQWDEQKLEIAKDLAVRQQNVNPIVTLATPVSIKAGTLLYHATTKEGLESIIKDGIRLDVTHTFKDPEMGKGLYVSSESGSYVDHDRKDT